jgi:hypothetical protein
MRQLQWLGLSVGIICSAWVQAAEVAPAAPTESATEGPRWERRIGEARDLKDGRVLYREEHLLRRAPDGDPQQRIVLYRCPDGVAFGRKTLDYGSNPLVPSFRMEDARWGYVEQLEPTGDGLQLTVNRPGENARSGTVAVEDSALVADAGYDEFVRQRWDELITGKKVPLDFIVPSRLTYYGFAVQLKREEQVEDGALKVFSLGLAGFFRIFLPEIEVAYDAETRELRRFVGLTNIRNVEDKNVEARISFPRGAEATTAEQAVAAAAEELSGRCP